LNDELVFRQFEEIERKVESLIKICKAHEPPIQNLSQKLKA